MNKTKYIPNTTFTYDDFLELDNQLYKIKLEKKKLEKENKQLKEKYENIISRFRFIKNRVNQGMIEKYKNECLIELGNNILHELEKGDDADATSN